ncbi:hypothetical protein GUJ93_ZPchr0010g10401 [Zizania palustris]|uniref:Uncharacterized protein n=1 Tax=Zizania palustris TaxID=103762 RepID=A0A8J6BNQ9_ZIZPA|nr:hypothetical protein GUJ93_ZPchr0010g10401 [Zizania palustris]
MTTATKGIPRHQGGGRQNHRRSRDSDEDGQGSNVMPTLGDGSRGNHLATDDNLNRDGFGYDVFTLGRGGPDRRSSCGLGREGPNGGSGILR